jgi:hypothetical protein
MTTYHFGTMPATFSAPLCPHDGLEAVCVLVYRWDGDGSEKGRSRPKCAFHRDEALNIWDRIKAVAPEAVENLTVLVVAP